MKSPVPLITGTSARGALFFGCALRGDSGFVSDDGVSGTGSIGIPAVVTLRLNIPPASAHWSPCSGPGGSDEFFGAPDPASASLSPC